jgi:hypothetical protein
MIMVKVDSDDDDPDRSISSSSFTGESGSRSGHDNNAAQDDAEKEMKDKIIKKEETAVRRARMIVIGGFIACATAVSVAVYKFASKADFQSFEQQVRNCCLRMILVLRVQRSSSNNNNNNNNNNRRL